MAGDLKAAVLVARCDPQPDGTNTCTVTMTGLSPRMTECVKARIGELFTEIARMSEYAFVTSEENVKDITDAVRAINASGSNKPGDA